MNTQNLWIDETNAAQWSEACHQEIAAWLSVIAGEQDGNASFAADLKIEVRPPTRKAAKRAFAFNTTLTGEIGFKWFDQEEVLTIPMSYHGVFLRRRDRARNPLTAVWPTWLAERQGFRIVTPTDLGKRTTSEWRIGLPGGHWIGATLADYEKLPAHEKDRFQKTRAAYLGVFDEVPEWLSPALGLFGPRGDGKRSAEGPMSSAANWRSIHNLILKKAQAKELPEPTDEDDLDHRMLLTFPVWLKHRISKGLLAAVLPRGRNEDEDWRQRVQQVLAGWEKGDADLASQMRSALWSSLATMGNKINWAINNYRSEDRADYIDPVNPLELVARITRVRRIHLPASKLQEMPAEFRQNHWSFDGRICPVESPESEQVGLTVHLASGATVDFDGKIHHAHSDAGRLGYGAGLVPFFAHNDGARNMMGAKNMRQALPLRNAEPPVIRTGGEDAVAAFAKPLVEAGLCPQAGKTCDDFYLGRDLLVAYLPWKGMNFEDSVVMGQQVVDFGLLDCIGFSKSLSRNLPVGWVPADPDDAKEVPGLVNGLVPSGTRISAGTPIACFKWEGKERTKQRVIRYQERTPVIVKRADFCRRSEWTGGKLECELELPIPIRPGDKLMGRHGNKGVVGTILPMDQMPCLPVDESLPEHLRGKPIDILLNPHGVISRMNLGQLLETHLGWLLKSGAFTSDDFHLHADDAHSPLASPFANVIDHEKVKESLESTGLDRYGRIQLILPGGEKTIAPVVVGFQHILRLRHIPELKSQARRGGNEALYAARTGQAIHGKKFGGGQRLGEMEVWALAAHQADAVLGEMLGIKSSADMIAANAADSLSQDGSSHTGYSRVFKDWLFALGIDLAEDANDVSLRFLADGAVCERIDEKNEVTASGSLESRIAASFGCVMGKRKPCGFQLLDGEKIEFKGSKSATDPTLTLGELLAHLGYKPSGKFVQDGDHYEVPLVDKSTGENSATLLLEFESVGDALKGVARFSIPAATARATSEQLSSLVDGMSQAEWEKPQPLPIVNLYGRFGNGSGKNWLANELIDQFLEEKPENWWKPAKQRNRCVTDMIVTCPHHRHIGIRGAKPFGEVFRSTPGGLFDPLIFGRYSRGFLSSNRWGYIKLPLAVKYPLHALLTSSLDPVDQERAEKRFISDLEKLGVSLCAIPEITHIPVLPTRYRLPAHSNGKLIRDEIERKGYAPLLAACQRYHEAAPEERAALAENIEMWVGSLFRRLAKSLGTKDGLIRRDGLGRRVDRSARLVVTPNPDLDWDKVGVPTAVLLELMGDSLEKWLIGRSPEEVEKTPLPTLQAWSWMRPGDNVQQIEDARVNFEAFFEAHKDFVVLLNRQPSLHRESFQAFKPVPLPADAGDVIQLCPLACKGFAADFDGDEMVIHVPMGVAAQEDARRLLPSVNLFSLATTPEGAENVLAHFDQDFVMGNWFLGRSDEAGLRRKFRSILPGEDCHVLVDSWNHPGKKQGAELLALLVSKHRDSATRVIEQWMRIAFEACTKVGVSFGYYEFREIAEALRSQVEITCHEQIQLIPEFTWDDARKGKNETDYNQALADIAQLALEEVLEGPNHIGKRGASIAAMALSGARGKKQIRQLIAARGMLEPGKTGFDPFDKGRGHFFFSQPLAIGHDANSAFWAAMNARSSMVDKKLGTGYAGGLTRSMVFALWPFEITVECCGSAVEKRSPVSCQLKVGCCAKCYGELPGGKLPAIGFPAGLIAAQSIGERGTQLSMQSFHAGASGIDIHTVRDLLRTSANFQELKQSGQFVTFMQKADAYENILDRHFQILWRVIHDSEQKSLPSAIAGQDALTVLANRHRASSLASAVLQGARSSRSGPIAKTLLGRFHSEEQTQKPD